MDQHEVELTPLCYIVTPIGMLGYGLDEQETDLELSRLVETGIPTALILDSGSTDSGPAKLALGSMTCPRSSYKRDLTKLVALIQKHKVPLIFTSAGGDGSGEHVDIMVDILHEIIEGEKGSNIETNVLTVYSDIPKSLVRERLKNNMIQGCGPFVPSLTDHDIETASRIVGQMGPEPLLDAMTCNPDFNILVGGRAYDPTGYVAYAAFQLMKLKQITFEQLDESIMGGLYHMGKIMECGAQCAVPKSKAARATIYANGTFDVTPLDYEARFTKLSVAAHTLYEKTRPDILHGPGGYLDLSATTYQELEDGRTVRARGALFKFSRKHGAKYTLKLEGARVRGYRTIFMGAFKDPLLTAQIDDFFANVQKYVKFQHSQIEEPWELGLHKFGATNPDAPGEVWIIGEALAATQEVATSVASMGRIACVHGPYRGQKANSGNLAMGLGGKLEIETGACAEFCIYHLMDLAEGEERAVEAGQMNGQTTSLFPWKRIQIGRFESSDSFPSESKPQTDNRNVEKERSQLMKDITNSYRGGHKKAAIKTLGDAAGILRSKNAGPYEVTLDILFNDLTVYQAIKESGLLTRSLIASLYSLEMEQVIYCGFFDQAMSFKATIPRMIGSKPGTSGNFLDDDVHGSQKYFPLMNVLLPEELRRKIE